MAASAVMRSPAAGGSRATGPAGRTKTLRTTNVLMRNGDESTLHGRLTSRRVALGLDQADIAERMGVARAAYSQYETGKVVPSLEKIEKVAKALETTPQWVAFGGMNHEIPIVEYVSSTRSWTRTDRTWPMPASWLKSKLPKIDPQHLEAFEATEDSDSGMVKAGDVVIVVRDLKPSHRTDEEYLFSMDGECRTDNIRKVDGGWLVGNAEGGRKPAVVNSRAIRIHGRVALFVGTA